MKQNHSRRKLLRTASVASVLGFASQSSAKRAGKREETPPHQEGISYDFSVRNNGTEKRTITVDITTDIDEGINFSKKVTLEGFNNQTADPEQETKMKSRLPGLERGEYTVEIQLADGTDEQMSWRLGDGGVSKWQAISVEITHQGELKGNKIEI